MQTWNNIRHPKICKSSPWRGTLGYYQAHLKKLEMSPGLLPVPSKSWAFGPVWVWWLPTSTVFLQISSWFLVNTRASRSRVFVHRYQKLRKVMWLIILLYNVISGVLVLGPSYFEDRFMFWWACEMHDFNLKKGHSADSKTSNPRCFQVWRKLWEDWGLGSDRAGCLRWILFG